MPVFRSDHLTLHVTLKYVVGTLLFVLFLWYILFQARLLIGGPKITLLHDLATIQDRRTVIIEGTAQNVTQITLNGRDIFVSPNGVFNETLVLQDGYTIMTIEARDRYGRTTSLSRSLVYENDS
jgi:hypothetical protein